MNTTLSRYNEMSYVNPILPAQFLSLAACQNTVSALSKELGADFRTGNRAPKLNIDVPTRIGMTSRWRKSSLEDCVRA